MRHNKLLCIVFSFISMTGVSEANDELLIRFDSNGDGYINLKESLVSKVLLEHFGAIDTDQDGKISAAELQSTDLYQEQDRTQTTEAAVSID